MEQFVLKPKLAHAYAAFSKNLLDLKSLLESPGAAGNDPDVSIDQVLADAEALFEKKACQILQNSNMPNKDNDMI